MTKANPKSNLKSFYKFSKLSLSGQTELLQSFGQLLDIESNDENSTNLYLIEGFFVEEIVNQKTKVVLEAIPYKNGFLKNSQIYSTSGNIINGGIFSGIKANKHWMNN